MKTCSVCKANKDETDFYRRSGGVLRNQCKVCKLKQDAENRLKNGDARREQQKRYHQQNRERRVSAMRERYAKVKDEDIERRRQVYLENRDRELATARRYYEANKEQAALRKKKWVERNRGKVNAMNKKRKVQAVRAMPPWADTKKIEAIYREAEEYKALGLDVHVDHIIPLQGRTVSGLHVHDNLRIILARDNIAKHNKLLPDLAPTALHEFA